MGINGQLLAERLRDGDLHRVLPGVYSTRVPTTMDKCDAVSLWRSDAVLSHRTALWLYGVGDEPSIIEAYVRALPSEPLPDWLLLRVPEYGIYSDTGALTADVVTARPSAGDRSARVSQAVDVLADARLDDRGDAWR